MYNSLSLNNFRGFKDFSMDLTPITLISGENNTGKTTVLESVFFLHDYTNPDIFLKLLNFRNVRAVNMSPQAIWEPLFYKMDTERTIKVSMGEKFSLSMERNYQYALPNSVHKELDKVIGDSSVNYALLLKVIKDGKNFKGDYILGDRIIFIGHKEKTPPFKTPFVQYLGPNSVPDDMYIAGWLGRVELSGKKHKLIECLRILDESITDVMTIVIDGFVQLYIKNNQNIKMPLHVMGDGMRKIVNVALALLANPSSILLLDEAENGLHYSLYSKFWALLSSLAKQEKCQIIATTHSYECISGALLGVKQVRMNDNFSYTRLDRDNERISPKTFTSEMLKFALAKDLEVR